MPAVASTAYPFILLDGWSRCAACSCLIREILAFYLAGLGSAYYLHPWIRECIVFEHIGAEQTPTLAVDGLSTQLGAHFASGVRLVQPFGACSGADVSLSLVSCVRIEDIARHIIDSEMCGS